MTATEGALFAGDGTNVVGRFVDANPFVTAANFNGPFATQTVISWGDGKSSVGTIVPDPLLAGVFDVVGTHIYASPTPVGLTNTISIAVQDQWGGKTVITNNVVVGAAPLTFAVGLTLPLTPGVPIVALKPFTSDVSMFTSANPAAVAGEYTATILWGDGSPADVGTVKEDGTGVFHISGTHTYGAAGMFTIDVVVLVTGGAIFVDPVTATVIAPQAKNVQADEDAGEDFITAGQSFTTRVAQFESNDPIATASDFTATIDWGDPSPDVTSGTIVQGANDPATGLPTFYVIGTHTYDEANTYTFTVSVSSLELCPHLVEQRGHRLRPHLDHPAGTHRRYPGCRVAPHGRRDLHRPRIHRQPLGVRLADHRRGQLGRWRRRDHQRDVRRDVAGGRRLRIH